MFIDEIEIEVWPGDGGPGRVSFHREKNIKRGKPDGGNGGRGGNVVITSRSNISSLNNLAGQVFYKAEKGRPGGPNNKTGKDGRDLKIFVPVGTVIKDAETGAILSDLNREGLEYIIAGGRGGLGNANFKSSTNRSPKYAQLGEKGENRKIKLELKLIADVGLIGFPNVGKSTLLSRISDAKPKIADYAFTTLSPNLGVVYYKEYKFLVADIPGLIKDAHKGAGLGLSFLRHIERTKILVYILDISESDAYEKFLMLKEELKFYNEELLNRPSLVVLNKIDKQGVEENIYEFKKKFRSKFYRISALNRTGINIILRELVKKLGKR